MRQIESEKQLESSLKDLVEKRLHGMCLKLLSQHVTGLPDRMCLLPGGRMFFVEVKTTGKKPRKIQEYIHKKLRSLGFMVYVLDSSEELYSIYMTYRETGGDNDEFDFGLYDPDTGNVIEEYVAIIGKVHQN